MKIPMTKQLTKGRRLPDTPFGDLPEGIAPGTYWKYLNRDGTHELIADKTYKSNLTGTVWGYMPPDGNGIGTLMQHTVREHEDGTITVKPGDGSSNSILHRGAQPKDWHGYIYNGVWSEL